MAGISGVLQQLGSNPLATPIGIKIDQATDHTLEEPDWAVNIEICDMINDIDEGPRDAIRAIKKRFQQAAGRNHTAVMLTLTVLETCVKNCGKRFHLLITRKDFVQDLVKLIGPKNDPPAALQERVLSLIQTWAETFGRQAELAGVYQVYQELKAKGIEFPASDLESSAPIHTPQRSVVSSSSTPVTHTQPPPQNRAHNVPWPAAQQQQHHHQPQPSMPVKLNPDQLAKLQSELDIVQGNMRVFDEMLQELTPGSEHGDDWNLLTELHETLEAMQKNIVELIERVANEEITIELLRINDELNTLFVRYEQFVKKKSSQNRNITKGLAVAAAAAGPQTVKKSPAGAESSLIDLGDEAGGAAAAAPAHDDTDALISRINSMAMASKNSTALPGGGDEFDSFAQSRSDTAKKPAPVSNSYLAELSTLEHAGGDSLASGADAYARGTADTDADQPSEFEEMERWLHDQPEHAAGAAGGDGNAFDAFLNERARAAEALPNANQQQQIANNKDKPQPDPFGL